MKFNLEEIKEILPHRDPFLFVDEVLEVSHPEHEKINSVKDAVGSKCVCTYKTKEDHPIFAGHFPGNPILPGVVQVEMMAQASSFTVAGLTGKGAMNVALLGIEKAKFRKPILPNMDLKMIGKCIKVRGSFMSFECEIFNGDELMSEATVLASVKF